MRSRISGASLAFTLTELLVVISIVGLLAGLISAGVPKAIEAGKWPEAKALVGQINQIQREGHEKYRSENEGH